MPPQKLTRITQLLSRAGWKRFFFTISVLHLMIVAGMSYYYLPNYQAVMPWDAIRELDDESIGMLYIASRSQEDPYNIESRGGLMVVTGFEQSFQDHFKIDYAGAIERNIKKKQLMWHVRMITFAWLFPVLFMAILFLAIKWIAAGFRPPVQPTKSNNIS